MVGVRPISSVPGIRGLELLAITTAKYGRISAAATRDQRSQPEPTTIAPTKHSVRMPIEMP